MIWDARKKVLRKILEHLEDNNMIINENTIQKKINTLRSFTIVENS